MRAGRAAGWALSGVGALSIVNFGYAGASRLEVPCILTIDPFHSDVVR